MAQTDHGVASSGSEHSSPESMTTIERRAAARKAARSRSRQGPGTDAPRSERRDGPPNDDGPNTVVWWHVANAIDLIHFPIVIALVVLGAVYFSGPVFVFLLTLMVTLQVATLGCPVMWLTGQLRKVHDPDYEVRWSVTAWLYQTYGRWFGVAVFVFFAGLTLLLRFLLF